MVWFVRGLILILLFGVVLLTPLFEVFDQTSDDFGFDTDFVLALFSFFLSTGLFLLGKQMIAFLFRVFLSVPAPETARVSLSSRSIQAQECLAEGLELLGSLRI